MQRVHLHIFLMTHFISLRCLFSPEISNQASLYSLLSELPLYFSSSVSEELLHFSPFLLLFQYKHEQGTNEKSALYQKIEKMKEDRSGCMTN